jgi:hypothetical protein
MRFDPGDSVVAVIGGDGRVGTIVRIAREERIDTINEGLVEIIRTYMVSWPMAGGTHVTSEATEANLRPATADEIKAASR